MGLFFSVSIFFHEGIVSRGYFFMWLSFAWVCFREVSFFVGLFCRMATFS